MLSSKPCSVQFVYARALECQFTLLLQAGLLLFQVGVLGHRRFTEQQLVIRRQLAGDHQQLLERVGPALGGTDFGSALTDFGIGLFQRDLQLQVLPLQPALRDCLLRGRGLRYQGCQGGRCHIAVQRTQQCAGAGLVDLCSQQFAAQTLDVSLGQLPFQLDQHIAFAHRLAIDDVDRLHHRDLAGLYQLAPATGHDPAFGTGDDIDLTDASPGKRQPDEHQQAPLQVARQGMHWRFLQGQCRR
ncbi:hypothetical protein D9M71_275860 [compost metagenome]